MIIRPDGREFDELRHITLTRDFLSHAEGSCLVELGNTRVITSASIEESVPGWLQGSGSGWVTAEYAMLPRATSTRNRRPGSSPGGRSMEIQRMIGRSLRSVVDFNTLGPRTIYLDCDVIGADGGTRVASIIGAAVALHDAGSWLIKNDRTDHHIMSNLVAAISIVIKHGNVMVDPSYIEDSAADVDMNIVMNDAGGIIEIQGAAEKHTFSRDLLTSVLDRAEETICRIHQLQRIALEIK